MNYPTDLAGSNSKRKDNLGGTNLLRLLALNDTHAVVKARLIDVGHGTVGRVGNGRLEMKAIGDRGGVLVVHGEGREGRCVGIIKGNVGNAGVVDLELRRVVRMGQIAGANRTRRVCGSVKKETRSCVGRIEYFIRGVVVYQRRVAASNGARIEGRSGCLLRRLTLAHWD